MKNSNWIEVNWNLIQFWEPFAFAFPANKQSGNPGLVKGAARRLLTELWKWVAMFIILMYLCNLRLDFCNREVLDLFCQVWYLIKFSPLGPSVFHSVIPVILDCLQVPIKCSYYATNILMIKVSGRQLSLGEVIWLSVCKLWIWKMGIMKTF